MERLSAWACASTTSLSASVGKSVVAYPRTIALAVSNAAVPREPTSHKKTEMFLQRRCALNPAVRPSPSFKRLTLFHRHLVGASGAEEKGQQSQRSHLCRLFLCFQGVFCDRYKTILTQGQADPLLR